MKKFVILLGILFAMQISLFAQIEQDNGDVVFNAHLQNTFNLNTDDVDQEIIFQSAADYNLGVTEVAGITPGFTEISVEATANWNLTIECPPFQGYNGTTGTIPINNLGVYCTTTAGGGHAITGPEVTCGCISSETIWAMSETPYELIGNGSGNAGAAIDNSFTLHWEMGTMGTTAGHLMNVESMFTQLAVPDFPIGDYTTTAILTLYSL